MNREHTVVTFLPVRRLSALSCIETGNVQSVYLAGRNRLNKDKCMFLLYIHANSVNNNRGSPNTGEQSSGLSMEFTLKASWIGFNVSNRHRSFQFVFG